MVPITTTLVDQCTMDLNVSEVCGNLQFYIETSIYCFVFKDNVLFVSIQ